MSGDPRFPHRPLNGCSGCRQDFTSAVRTRGELEELQARFEVVKAEADMLNELNARIETAKHVGDLFP